MPRTRRRFSDAFKATVTLEAIKGVSTIAVIARQRNAGTHHVIAVEKGWRWRVIEESRIISIGVSASS